MIEVKNLVKKYGNHLAVDHLDFTVEDGQIYGFLGPNGAGKSTTMNIMTGYIAATEGQVLINGHDIMEEPEEAKKCIGYLPELPPLYQDMTVLEYLKFVTELKKYPKAERKAHIEEIMETVKISDMANRLIKNLSKGYKQRVGLAQALVGYPEVIILDEPTVGLDPKQIIEIRDLIRSLGKKHTVILSSHILSEVSAVCDHIMIISHGKLVASDTPENLSKLSEGSVAIQLELRGDMETLKRVINGLENVDYVEANAYNKDTKLGKYVVHTKNNADIREDIFFAMAKQNCPILEMTITSKSLEDVFLELTADKNQVEELVEDTEQTEEIEETEPVAETEEEVVKEDESC